ncbi:calcyphosin-2-like [Oscarella lobularis]|uniref:calcyphosin-2-like n=1 Tax=Oscarella lobularis TaxID=121494 RepID=UPI003313C6AC
MSQPEFFVYGRATPRHSKTASGVKKTTSSISSKSSTSTPHAPRIFDKQRPKATFPHYTDYASHERRGFSATNTRKSAWDENEEPTAPSQRVVRPFRNVQKHATPEGIPKLALGKLVDPHELDPIILAASPGEGKIKVSTSTLSWGTPLGSAMTSHRRAPVPSSSSWQRETRSSSSRVNVDVPPLDLSFKEPKKEAVAAEPWEEEAENDEQEVTKAISVREAWGETSKGTSKNRIIGFEEEEKKESKKEMAVVSEAVDRMCTSNPFGHKSPALPQQSPALYVGGRRKTRYPFDSRSSKVPQTESLMSDRVRFNARVVTSNGRDIHRQLCGFYFAQDSTLTIYEFRQLSSRASALPLIQRGSYQHGRGPKRGKPISVIDIRAGCVLSFSTHDQPSLPETLKGAKTYVSFSIIDADENAKQKIMKHREEESEEVQQYWRALKKLKDRISDKVERQLKGRASVVTIGLVRQFQPRGTPFVSKSDFAHALKSFRVDIDSEDFDDLWDMLDEEGDGKLDYVDLVHSYLSEMNDLGKSLVIKAFIRMDAQKMGTLAIESMKKFFNPRGHPRVAEGNKTEAQVYDEVFSVFSANRRKELTYQEFEAYYDGVFQEVKSDDAFVDLVKKTWNV